MIQFDTDKYYFDEKAAKGVVTFFETKLTHPKGPISGKPFILQEWQKDNFFHPFFGIKKKSDNFRRFKKAYIEIPKKNGKTPIMAGIVLLMLKYIVDNGGKLASLASSRDQAKLIYDDMCQMIMNSPELSKEYTIYQGSIMYGTKSYKPLSADVGTNDGASYDVVIIDEFHHFTKSKLYDQIVGSQATKDDPILIIITTAGDDKNSLCYEMRQYAQDVRDGVIKDDTFLPLIYAADNKDDPFIEETWIKANPNYGVSVKKDFMYEQSLRAKSSKSYLNSFLRLHLNIWTDVKDVWITDEMWQSCSKNLDISKLKGELAFGGLDLSNVSDITAFSLLFPPSNRDYYPDEYLSFNWFWLPKEKGKDSADKNNVYYLQWVSDGYIEETNGNKIDYNYIQEKILNICSDFTIGNFAYDPYNSTQIASRLTEEGLPMFAHRQGFVSMNFPTKQLEVKLGRNEFLHDNNPVLRWMVSNAVLKTNTEGSLCKIDKNQTHQKIDGVVTNIMALGLAISGEDTSQGSYLEQNDLMYIEL